jgi:hypothetical protein
MKKLNLLLTGGLLLGGVITTLLATQNSFSDAKTTKLAAQGISVGETFTQTLSSNNYYSTSAPIEFTYEVMTAPVDIVHGTVNFISFNIINDIHVDITELVIPSIVYNDGLAYDVKRIDALMLSKNELDSFRNASGQILNSVQYITYTSELTLP